jgi:hypothetical protein
MLIFGNWQAKYFCAQILNQAIRLIPLNKSHLVRTIDLQRRSVLGRVRRASAAAP